MMFGVARLMFRGVQHIRRLAKGTFGFAKNLLGTKKCAKHDIPLLHFILLVILLHPKYY